MKKLIALFLLLSVSVVHATESKDFSMSGGLDLVTSYVTPELFKPNDSFVAEPWFDIEHSSGVYFNFLAFAGLESKDGNEIDLTTGYRKTFGDFKIDTSIGYYRLITNEADIYTASILIKFKEHWWTRFQYFDPTDGNSGWRLRGGYNDKYWGFALIHTHDFYNEGQITIAEAALYIPIIKNVKLSVTGRAPIIKSTEDKREAQIIGSLHFSF